MAIKGIFASNQGMIGDRRGDFANAVLQLGFTGTSLLVALLSGMQQADCSDTIFNWYEDTHISGRTSIISGTTTTTVVVADDSFYVPNTLLQVEETGEVIWVTAAVSGTLTVIRGMGGTTVTSVDSTMHVVSIGNANPEGSTMPTAKSQQGKSRSNLVQIFRNSWAITGTAKKIDFRTGDRKAINKRQCAMYHAEDMERSFMWGVKSSQSVNGNHMRTTDGLKTQIQQFGGYTLSAASDSGSGAVTGSLHMADLQEFMRTLFSTNVKGQPNERIVLCGDLVVAAIQTMARLDSLYNIEQGENSYGINVTEVSGPFGKLKFLSHQVMNENPVWQKEAYCFHPGAVRRRMYRPTFEENYDQNGLRANGVDADQGLMTTEAGIEVGAASVMGVLTGVVRGSKSKTT